METVKGRQEELLHPVRHFSVGAEVLPEGGVSFRVWAPKRRAVQVVVSRDPRDRKPSIVADLQREQGSEGYFSGTVDEAAAGMFYGFRLDDASEPLPDPASRFQPQGPLGLSQIVDPRSFKWTDAEWKGLKIQGQVIYEMHVGTLTSEGTWTAALERLPDIAEAGMTVIEVMPLADFPGQFGWGYDGVCLFAPTRLYGPADDFRQFVDRAHALGLGVILDVVYNHFGLIGCTVTEFSDDYFSRRHKNEWGSPINFDDERAGPVREFFVANVRYWIEEFHLDGFRFDATQSIFDDSESHILTEMAQAARDSAGKRSVILLAENEPQDVRLVRSADKGGHGFDALCNDDFHHTARVRLTGLTEAYYEDYRGSIDELRSVLLRGFLYQGQISQHQGKRRGSPARGVPATALIHFLQNHDQVANTGLGANPRIDEPGPVAGDDRALAPVAANADVFSGAGIRGRALLSCISPTSREKIGKRSLRGGSSFCHSFPRSPPRNSVAPIPIRPTARRSSGANCAGPNASSTKRHSPCTRICSRCDARIPCSGGSVWIGSKRPPSARIASSCAISARRGTTSRIG